MPPEAAQNPSTPGSLALWLPGALLGIVVVGAAIVVGGERIPESAVLPALIGAVVAAVLGLPGVLLKLRAARQPTHSDAGGPLTGGIAAVQIAVLTDFLLNAVAIGAGLVGMSISGMKFDMAAGFGLAYATVALAVQVLSGVGLARTLRSSGIPAGNPVGGPEAGTDPVRSDPPGLAQGKTAVDTSSSGSEPSNASGPSSPT